MKHHRKIHEVAVIGFGSRSDGGKNTCTGDEQKRDRVVVLINTVTMMPPPLISLLLALLLVSLFTSVRGECDQCQFTADDAEDCKVYGAIDDKLVAWNKASSDCLEQYTISISSIDPSAVGCGSPRNVNSFVNAIKFESIPNSVRGGLGESEGFFFVQENGVYVLKDTITVGGSTIDCEASESDCYNAMRAYFAASGMEEMNQVCDTIVDKVAVDRELEQSTVRNQLCSDIKANVSPPSVCEPLASQVSDEVNANPSKDCSGFQFGPGNMEIPGCGSTNNASGSTTSSAKTSYNTGCFTLIFASCVSLLVG